MNDNSPPDSAKPGAVQAAHTANARRTPSF